MSDFNIISVLESILSIHYIMVEALALKDITIMLTIPKTYANIITLCVCVYVTKTY